MALGYRSIWSGCAPHASDTTAVAFAGRVKGKSPGAIDESVVRAAKRVAGM